MKDLQQRISVRGLLAFLAAVVIVAASAVFALYPYPREWLRWRLNQVPAPVVDTSAAVVAQGHWQGEWDEQPEFWGCWQPFGEDDLRPLPDEYRRLPVPMVAGEYTYIGGSVPWLGLEVTIEVPNDRVAKLVVEYWDGGRWAKSLGRDGTYGDYSTLDRSGVISIIARRWAANTLDVGGESFTAYWARFSVSANLAQRLEGWAMISHDAPTLRSADWEMRFHRATACQNRPGLKMLRVTVLGADGEPLEGVKVGFDTVPSYGVAYDHMDIWGLTDENGYLEWNHLGVPTRYRLWIGELVILANIRTDLGYGYCGSGPGSWRPVNRPGIVSYDFELVRK